MYMRKSRQTRSLSCSKGSGMYNIHWCPLFAERTVPILPYCFYATTGFLPELIYSQERDRCLQRLEHPPVRIGRFVGTPSHLDQGQRFGLTRVVVVEMTDRERQRY
jgi:hypothetical protein